MFLANKKNICLISALQQREMYSHINKFLVIFFLIVSLLYAETINVTTYNILNFPEAFGTQRIDDFQIIIDDIKPDILVVQEMQSQAGVDLFLNSVMNNLNNLFAAVPFHDGPDTDNALFYRADKISFISATYLSTPNRDIAEYKLRIIESQIIFYIFSVHFKSSQSDSLIRLQEATILRNYLNSLASGTDFIVVGDFNIYYSDEPAYHKLTDSFANNNGRSYDPINAYGYWHENNNFAYTHTQSTRTEQLNDGGASGGLDDRFDIILCSQSFFDSSGLYILKDSYTMYGNDGNHFDVAINYGSNQSVPADVADALYFASDHLPVFVNITDDFGYSVSEEEVVKIWPNPMETVAQIRFPWFDDFQNAKITVTNILGQRVYDAETQSPIGLILRKEILRVGIYFVHVKIETRYNKHNFHTKLAVVK